MLTVASSRYIPGTSSGYQQPYQPSTTDPYTAHTAATPTSRKHLPQKSYLFFKVGELGVIINKMNTFNTEVPPNHVPFLLPHHLLTVGCLCRNIIPSHSSQNPNLATNNPTSSPCSRRSDSLMATTETFPCYRYSPTRGVKSTC
jgi:hypothetical protein